MSRRPDRTVCQLRASSAPQRSMADGPYVFTVRLILERPGSCTARGVGPKSTNVTPADRQCNYGEYKEVLGAKDIEAGEAGVFYSTRPLFGPMGIDSCKS